MKRRSLLLLSTLLGSLAPLRLLAQEPARSKSARTRRDLEEPPRTARGRLRDEDQQEADPPAAADREDVPPNLPTEVGHQWRNFDISRYTGLPHKENNPQSSIVDWVFRRTTTTPWHGEKIAVLAAGRSKLRVYHNAKILDQVAEVVERFADTEGRDFLTLKVRVVGAVDPRWRYTVYRKLNLISTGPQGQQVWTVDSGDAAQLLSLMQLTLGARLHAERKFELINGQTLTTITSLPRQFTGAIQRDSAVAQGFQPKAEELEEGVTLRISPLLSFEGDTIDAAVVLTTNNVRTFHPVRVLAPREIGPAELKLEVPEVSETQLNQTVKGWPVGKTLVISAGIQPGILQQKGGLFNMKIPGTVPTSTEVLVFIDVEIGEDSMPRKADRGRTRR